MADDKDKKDINDEIDQYLGADEGDNQDDESGAGADQGAGGQANSDDENKPVTMKELKELMESIGKQQNNGSVDMTKFKEEMVAEMNKLIEPVLKETKKSEFKNSVKEFEDKVKKDYPGFFVDVDALETQMALGKTKKEALAVQVENEKKRAEAYGYKKEPKNEDGYNPDKGQIDLNGFDPELPNNRKVWDKMKPQDKASFWNKYAMFKRNK